MISHLFNFQDKSNSLEVISGVKSKINCKIKGKKMKKIALALIVLANLGNSSDDEFFVKKK